MADIIIALAFIVPATGWLVARAVAAHRRGVQRLRRNGL